MFKVVKWLIKMHTFKQRKYWQLLRKHERFMSFSQVRSKDILSHLRVQRWLTYSCLAIIIFA